MISCVHGGEGGGPLGLIHTIGPVALRSRSGLGSLSVLRYSHVRSALAPISLPSFSQYLGNMISMQTLLYRKIV